MDSHKIYGMSQVKKGEPDINKFTSQIFVNYNLQDGWYITSSPVFTADWEADNGEKWTIPVGGGFGRLVRFGDQPIDFKTCSILQR